MRKTIVCSLYTYYHHHYHHYHHYYYCYYRYYHHNYYIYSVGSRQCEMDDFVGVGAFVHSFTLGLFARGYCVAMVLHSHLDLVNFKLPLRLALPLPLRLTHPLPLRLTHPLPLRLTHPLSLQDFLFSPVLRNG